MFETGKLKNIKHFGSFTLIELLIVIVIIGILAVALVPRLTGMQAKARDTKRIADLKQIQTALEMYANDNNGNYPVTSPRTRRGNCLWYNSGGTHIDNWIPGLIPQYINSLPRDPKERDPSSCYLYISNGIDYMVLIHQTAETKVPDEFKRNLHPTQNSMSIYTPGAKMW